MKVKHRIWYAPMLSPIRMDKYDTEVVCVEDLEENGM